MSMRQSSLLVGLCIAIAAAGLLSPAAAQQWQAPRTSHGHPDLQGNWSNQTMTPVERPEGQGPMLTPEQVARREGRAEAAYEAGASPSDPNRPPLEAGSAVGGYNRVYLDPGMLVAVVNGEPRSSLITDPPDGRRPALTVKAQQIRDEVQDFMESFGPFDNPENRTLADRCIVGFGAHGGPPMTPNYGYNSNYTIVQTADYVMIHTEQVHDTRIIYLREPEPVPDDVRPWFGVSYGHWEGETLVVETTNIHPLQQYRPRGFVDAGVWEVRPSPSMKITERLTRVDEDGILYEFTIEDPETYTRPWSGQVPFWRFDNLLYEYNCHEGNYAMSNILSGARFQEREGNNERD